MAEIIDLEEKEVEGTAKPRAEGKYVRWFKEHSEDILTLPPKKGMQILPNELRDPDGKAIGTTTVQYNLMRVFYAAEIPFKAVTSTKVDPKDGIEKTYVVIKRSGEKFDPGIYGVSHKKDTAELRTMLQEYLKSRYPEMYQGINLVEPEVITA